MSPSRAALPPPAAPPRPGFLRRVGDFLVWTWPGRVLLAAVLLFVLSSFGVPLPCGLDVLSTIVLFLFGAYGLFRLGRFLVHRLLWRIRTKLIVSYLFIAVVPLVLLLLLFSLAGILFSGLVGSHILSTEIDRAARDLAEAALGTLAALPSDDAGARAAVERLSAPLRARHPDLAYSLLRSGKVVARSYEAPESLPAWIQPSGFAGLVKEGEKDALRAVAMGGGTVLIYDVPVDQRLFADLEKRMGIHVLPSRRAATGKTGGVRITVGEADATPTTKDAPAGFPFLAAPERRRWADGKVEADPLSFVFQPYDLFRRLSPGSPRAQDLRYPESLNMADVLVKALAAVGGVFLVVYCVALVLGFVLARSITSGIHELSRGTERLRLGDFTRPIRTLSRDQLGDLAESFNLMADSVRDLLLKQADKERLEEELRIARQIQMSLLPQGAVTLPGLRIAALCLPAAEVGGDYYDLLPLSDTRMGVLVADVSGKGTSAALYMAELKGLVLSLSRIYESPARLLGEANRILSANMDARSFITMTYAVVDTAARTMRYARAGHNPILHLEARTGATRVLTPQGLGLGLDRGDRFEEILEEAEVRLESGDVFLFFTDGLSEAMNSRAELFGERRLRDVLEEGGAGQADEGVLKDRILEEIRAFVGSAAQHDDMTMVLLKVV